MTPLFAMNSGPFFMGVIYLTFKGDELAEFRELAKADVMAALSRFTGRLMQTPPLSDAEIVGRRRKEKANSQQEDQR